MKRFLKQVNLKNMQFAIPQAPNKLAQQCSIEKQDTYCLSSHTLRSVLFCLKITAPRFFYAFHDQLSWVTVQNAFCRHFFFVKLQRVVASLPPWEIQVDFVVVARGRFWQPSFSTMLPGQLLHSGRFSLYLFCFPSI